jgi:hypothetical protein
MSFFPKKIHSIKNENLVTFTFTTTREASIRETNDIAKLSIIDEFGLLYCGTIFMVQACSYR